MTYAMFAHHKLDKTALCNAPIQAKNRNAKKIQL
jgi:hypothetical protein